MAKAAAFIDPEAVEIDGQKFWISKIPAFTAQEIFMSAVQAFQNKDASSLPKGTMLKLCSYVAVPGADENDFHTGIPLDTEASINVNVNNVFTLLQVEVKMIEKNFGFLFDGRLQKALESIPGLTKLTETSTH